MLIYNPDAKISFVKYGILIPSLDSRKTNTIKALQEDPELGPRQDEWLISDFPRTLGKEDLQRAHSPEYTARLYGDDLESVLLESYELVDEEGRYNRYEPDSAEAPLGGIIDDVMNIVSGSYAVIPEALKSGFAYFLGGGMHHAHPDFGHGFCLVNDISIALLKAKEEGLFKTAWIIDIDAHRGDGTAEIMADHPDIQSLSIHMAAGWPLDSPEYREDGSLNPSWFPGDVDIPIVSGEEAEYTDRLLDEMCKMEEKGRPDFVFVVAGVDPYEKDELPSTSTLQMTKEQMLDRDQRLYCFLEERSIPSAWLSAGGYGASSWEIHTQFLKWVLKKRLN
ncbi:MULTISPECIES: histone deacetylase [unclassified Oceanispirochaeta]|uniref:histone deacetylase n=1 Tax=unclassified Oceanispirochaeta TaxID=2635722 RepID=UPI000E092288|nr:MULTISPECIES: histone deacetylase [unclassified Oceanispirochaeta]MBF9015896.1 histone deacetylase [Oceanispirochaeta sp. M2]NPD72359.1 histone deacetylase [Oceanispirochaeta sp. M1]RDG32130.1 histone deacetylase [Oceanispirochaeta sp. M1]